jgi:hypothetical protein
MPNSIVLRESSPSSKEQELIPPGHEYFQSFLALLSRIRYFISRKEFTFWYKKQPNAYSLKKQAQNVFRLR